PDVGLRSQARAGATVPGDSRCSGPLVVELVADATAHRPAVLIVKVQAGDFRSLANNPAICGAEVHRGDARPVGPFDRSECKPDVGLRSQARAGATVPGDSRCSGPLVVELVADATAHRPAVLIVKVQAGDFRSLANNPAICGAEVHRGDARPVGPFDRSECK